MTSKRDHVVICVRGEGYPEIYNIKVSQSPFLIDQRPVCWRFHVEDQCRRANRVKVSKDPLLFSKVIIIRVDGLLAGVIEVAGNAAGDDDIAHQSMPERGIGSTQDALA